MEMISFEEAFGIVMNSAPDSGEEKIPFASSLGRVLKEDITCDMDMPPFNKSTVDGYACRRSDLSSELELLEVIAAGKAPVRSISSQQCSGIMTGAAVPEGADMVFMVEESEILPSGRIRYTGSSSKDNIAYTGEDLKSGDIVIRKGKIIKPQDIAVIALSGVTEISVGKKPEIAVISTGNELVEPWEKPGAYQIRNTNACQLMAQAEQAGAAVKYYGIARDDKQETSEIISKALSECDVLLISGGVSMGEFDYVPAVLEEAGVRVIFTSIRIQPGKPTTFGVRQKTLVFGLPGNPVSSFVQFETLVRPLIYKMMGSAMDIPVIDVPVGMPYSRRSAERKGFIPVCITGDGKAVPVDYHGSAHISAYLAATGIAEIPEGVMSLEKGEIVRVRQI